MHRRRDMTAIWMLLGPALLVFSGCAMSRLPAIDPSGERLFLPQPNYTTLASDGPFARLLHRDRLPVNAPLDPNALTFSGADQPTLVSDTGICGCPQLYGIEPVFEAPAFPPACGADGFPPEDGPCYPVGSPSESSLTATIPDFEAVGSGVGSPSCGTETPQVAAPSAAAPQSGPRVVISPGRLVAAVGREVVLVGGVQSTSGDYLAGEPVQWSLSQDSAGTIVDAGGQRHRHHKMFGLFGRPAVRRGGDLLELRTGTRGVTLRRNPLDPQDDIYISRGQTWLSVTSGSEGISYVTLAATQLRNWAGRQETASIIWVDGQWSFPPPAVSSLEGPAEMVTYVTRQSDGQPIAGWVVRYSVVDGPEAALDLDNSRQVDVLTDGQGRAAVNVYPLSAVAGTTRLNVQIIKPQTRPGEPRQVVVGEGHTSVAWGATGPSPAAPAEPFDATPVTPSPIQPEIPATEPTPDTISPQPTPEPPPAQQEATLTINVDGPTAAQVGDQVTYRIIVRNIGQASANDVQVSTTLPESGLQFLGSNPQAFGATRQYDWSLRTLRPGDTATILAQFRVTDAGRLRNVFYVEALNASPKNDGVTTEVTRQVLFVSVSDPDPFQVQVGQDVNFNVTVVNRGDQPLDVELVDLFDPGLQPVVAGPSPADPAKGIKQVLRLPAQAQRSVRLTFRGLDVGTYRHRVEVTSPQGDTAFADGVVQVIPARRPALELDVQAPREVAAGTITDQIQVRITNTGDTELTGMRIQYRYDEDLIPMTGTNGTTGDFQLSQMEPILTWTVRPVAPGEGVLITIVAQANANPLKSQIRSAISVTTDQGVQDQRDIVVDIVRGQGGSFGAAPGIEPGGNGTSRPPSAESNPPPAGDDRAPNNLSGRLEARVEALSSSVRVNEPIEYRVTIRNNSSQSYRDLVVTLRIAEGMQFTGGATGPPGTRTTLGGNGLLLQFSPLREMRPTDELTYRAQAAAQRPGVATLVAQADAIGLSRPVVVQATTDVN